MLGVDMTEPDIAKAAVQSLLDHGILINRTHDTVLRFLPPYIIKKKHVDQVVSALDAALSANPPAAAKSASTRKRKSN
jgi:acetylornithine aminotransferase/acetylornithine/N-succinyldiaminopimelate aminotransferase